MEAQYYEYLLEQQKIGNVTKIELQPHIEIIPAYEKYGRKIRKSIYSPDFLVFYSDGSHKYIEIKGVSKPDANLRRKLFDHQRADDLLWITGDKIVKGRYTEWKDYDDLRKERRERKKLKKTKEVS
jgi:hypothetical protein